MLFDVKENEQFHMICYDITIKQSSHKKMFGVTIDNKLSFDEHIINICKTANKNLNALSRTNRNMKQNQKKLLLSSYIISHFSYCPFVWMFCSKKSTKKINAVHERSLRNVLNDYESSYPLLLEEAQEITFHQRCINSLMIEIYKYLNGHSLDIINDIFKLREKMYNLQNFHILQTEISCSLKYGLDATPYRDVHIVLANSGSKCPLIFVRQLL